MNDHRQSDDTNLWRQVEHASGTVSAAIAFCGAASCPYRNNSKQIPMMTVIAPSHCTWI